jgi:hypothetical protein
MPSVKMLGNMIELKNPTAIIDTIATCPKVSIETTTNRHATAAAIESDIVEGARIDRRMICTSGTPLA